MVICFSCPHATKAILDELVATGDYGDHSQVIVAALENLAMLQRALATSGVLVIGDRGAELAGQSDRVTAQPKANGLAVREHAATTSAREAASQPSQPTPESPPALFLLNGLATASAPPLAELPADSWLIGQEVPLSRWTFGQFNKLLPAKVSCRGLAHLLAGDKRGLDLDESAQRVATEAAILGDYLTDLDSRRGHSRDQILATAFPTTGDKAAKSRLRYANQFVGSVNKQGQLSGLLVSLKLVNWLRGSTRRLSLTSAGLRFALLPNPVLSSTESEYPRRFSDDELEFLLEHLATNVPVERSAYQQILTLISSGVDTPTDLDKALEETTTSKKGKPVTSAFLSTQRSGAVSRMADLDLLTRRRDGVKVQYVVTDRGQSFWSRTKEEDSTNE